MTDTVQIVTQDTQTGVLAPTLADAIAAGQLYASITLANSILAENSASSASVSANAAENAASTAISASSVAAGIAANAAAARAVASIGTTVLGGTPTLVPISKFMRALKAAGNLQVVTDYVLQSANSSTSDLGIEFARGTYVQSNGLVYSATQAALGFSAGQMEALMLTASSLSG